MKQYFVRIDHTNKATGERKWAEADVQALGVVDAVMAAMQSLIHYCPRSFIAHGVECKEKE